jgi:hypothetical protein
LVAGFILGTSGFTFSPIVNFIWAWTIEPKLRVPATGKASIHAWVLAR